MHEHGKAELTAGQENNRQGDGQEVRPGPHHCENGSDCQPVAKYKAPGVKITAKQFGRDRRYPITNRFRDD